MWCWRTPAKNAPRKINGAIYLSREYHYLYWYSIIQNIYTFVKGIWQCALIFCISKSVKVSLMKMKIKIPFFSCKVPRLSKFEAQTKQEKRKSNTQMRTRTRAHTHTSGCAPDDTSTLVLHQYQVWSRTSIAYSIDNDKQMRTSFVTDFNCQANRYADMHLWCDSFLLWSVFSSAHVIRTLWSICHVLSLSNNTQAKSSQVIHSLWCLEVVVCWQ